MGARDLLTFRHGVHPPENKHLTEGLASRVSFEELTAACADAIHTSIGSGRQVLLVGESFGAILAVAVAH